MAFVMSHEIVCTLLQKTVPSHLRQKPVPGSTGPIFIHALLNCVKHFKCGLGSMHLQNFYYEILIKITTVK